MRCGVVDIKGRGGEGGGRREEGARVFFPCDNEGWPGLVLGEQIGGVWLLVNCCDYNSSVTNSGIT